MLDLLEIDIVTGRRTSLPAAMRRALRALRKSRVRFAVIGATALAVRGLPRMTRDLDVCVTTEDAWTALDALQAAGFVSIAPVDRDPVNLLVAAGEPESTVVADATDASVFGVQAPVATLEHLVLMYLYSNQVRHRGDLARIVVETDVDLIAVERYLEDVHPEMLPVLREQVETARHPPAPPPRPARRRGR